MSRFLALDFEASTVLVASGSVRGEGVVVERSLAWADTRTLSKENAASLGESFKEALRTANISAAPALVAVGRDRLILKELRFPPVAPSQEPNLVRFQAMKELSESPDEVVLDYVPGEVVNGERRATAYVLRKEQYEAIQAFLTSAGLKLAAVTPRPFAVAAALRRVMTLTNEAVAAVTLGSQGGEFTVFQGEAILFTRAIPAPAVTTSEALTAELKRNLAIFGASNANSPITGLYVAESKSLGHVGKLKLLLSLPVHAFDPFIQSDVPGEDSGRFAGAVGLLALRRQADLPINFASPRHPKAEADPNRKLLLLTALACCLLLGLGFIYGFLQLNRAGDRLASAERQKKNTEELLVAIEADAKRLQAVDDWSKREVVWLDEMYDLFDRFPDIDRIRMKSLKGDALAVDKAGKQPAQAKLDVLVNTSNPELVNSLLSAFDRENPERNKFYVNPTKLSRGTESGTSVGALNLAFAISTLVNHRSPTEFVRQTLASPPASGRKNAEMPIAPPSATAATPPVKTPETKSSSGFRPANFNDDWFK